MLFKVTNRQQLVKMLLCHLYQKYLQKIIIELGKQNQTTLIATSKLKSNKQIIKTL